MDRLLTLVAIAGGGLKAAGEAAGPTEEPHWQRLPGVAILHRGLFPSCCWESLRRPNDAADAGRGAAEPAAATDEADGGDAESTGDENEFVRDSGDANSDGEEAWKKSGGMTSTTAPRAAGRGTRQATGPKAYAGERWVRLVAMRIGKQVSREWGGDHTKVNSRIRGNGLICIYTLSP
jgi:hypothetical protein